VYEHVKFGVNFKTARWNAETSKWTMELEDGVVMDAESADAQMTTQGKTYHKEVRVLVSGIGGFSKPVVPEIKGLPSGTGLRPRPATEEEAKDGNFSGIVVHSARYPRNGLDLSGKSVLVVGNGCSGSQIVSEISKDPSIKVYATARSAQWFMPQWVTGCLYGCKLRRSHSLNDGSHVEKYSTIRHTLYRIVPFLARLQRFFVWLIMDSVWWLLRLHKGAWLRDPVEKVGVRCTHSAAPSWQLTRFYLGCSSA
jgi:hypothetical protein